MSFFVAGLDSEDVFAASFKSFDGDLKLVNRSMFLPVVESSNNIVNIVSENIGSTIEFGFGEVEGNSLLGNIGNDDTADWSRLLRHLD